MKAVLVRLCIVCCVVFGMITTTKAQLITTVVGGGYATGQSATNIGIGPVNTTIDPNGNLVVADVINSRVFRIDKNTGMITVIAGLGIIGNYGDGGPAAAACFYNPNDVCYDPKGNLYVADFNNNKIRKIDTAGVITTYAGTGAFAYGGDGGPAIDAQLNRPAGVYADAVGNIFIADEFNHCIRRIDASGTITTIAGCDTAGFAGDGGPATAAKLNYPTSVKMNKAGELIIVDQINFRIRKIDNAGLIHTIAGGGTSTANNVPATVAQIGQPLVASIDTEGNIYVSDFGKDQIRKVDTGGIYRLVAGTGTTGFSGDGGPATMAKFRRPQGVTAAPDGSIYVCDFDGSAVPNSNNRIRKIAANGIVSTIAGDSTLNYGGDGDPWNAAQIYHPTAFAIAPNGEFYVADSQVIIRKADASGLVNTFAGIHNLHYPVVIGEDTPRLSNRFEQISSMMTDKKGNLFIADAAMRRVRKIDTNGLVSTYAGGATSGVGDNGPATSAMLGGPTGLAFDRYGNLFIADSGADRVRKVDTAGIITTVAGYGLPGYTGNEGPATSARLLVNGIAVDDSGRIFLSDGIARIRMIDATGIIHAFAGTGTALGDGGAATAANLTKPRGLAVDHNGNLYIADYGNNRIRFVENNGLIHTLAGNGDGMDVSYSELNGPYDVRIDLDGNVLFSDMNNFRIRKIWLNTGLRDPHQPAISAAVSVTPNPTFGNLNAVLEGPVLIEEWVLTDLKGREQWRQHVADPNSRTLTADFSRLPTGMYLIHALCREGVFSARVLLVR